MSKEKFVTPYNYFPPLPEENGGEMVTEQAGYIPPKVQIENMILAGQRLSEYRREMYDFSSEEEDDGEFVDPTRRPNFDLVDATELVRNASESLKKSAAKKKAEKAEEKAPQPQEKAPEASEKKSEE
jgi:hypothetical protein